MHMVVRREKRSDGEVLRVEQTERMIVLRGPNRTVVEASMESTETPQGQLLECQTEMHPGGGPVRVMGRVEGYELHLTVTSPLHEKTTSTLPWPAGSRRAGQCWSSLCCFASQCTPESTARSLC